MRLLAVSLLLLVVGRAAFAAPIIIPVTNDSFESPVLSEGTNISTVSGWTASGTVGTWNPPGTTFYDAGTITGNQIAFARNGGSITQNVGLATLGAVYDLTVDILDRRAFATPFGYTIQLLVGATVVASETSLVAIPEGSSITRTITYFTTGADVGQAVSIRLLAGPTHDVAFDNVRLVNTVPEPTTLALFAIGGVAALRHRNRRRGDGLKLKSASTSSN